MNNRQHEDLARIGYGDRRDYPKIDLWVQSPSTGQWNYVATTTWARTCREAVAHFKKTHPEQIVKARFVEPRKR
jgi:hypothetical protein